jgi:hypothetical protein
MTTLTFGLWPCAVLCDWFIDYSAMRKIIARREHSFKLNTVSKIVIGLDKSMVLKEE